MTSCPSSSTPCPYTKAHVPHPIHRNTKQNFLAYTSFTENFKTYNRILILCPLKLAIMSRALSKKEAQAQQLQQQQQQQYARDVETQEHHASANASVRILC